MTVSLRVAVRHGSISSTDQDVAVASVDLSSITSTSVSLHTGCTMRAPDTMAVRQLSVCVLRSGPGGRNRRSRGGCGRGGSGGWCCQRCSSGGVGRSRSIGGLLVAVREAVQMAIRLLFGEFLPWQGTA